jgi:signal transduction histidine kinase
MVARDQRQIQSMIRLIDDMLDISRIRSGSLSIRSTELELMDLLRRVVADLALQASGSGSTITLHPHAPVRGCWDQFRIEQVIINLLTNALRYGAGQPVAIVVEAAGETVRIDVIDAGVGIPAADLERIFEPFERGSGNREAKGLGLGLAISRQLAAARRPPAGQQRRPQRLGVQWSCPVAPKIDAIAGLINTIYCLFQ